MNLADVMAVYAGSDGAATTALYERLERLGTAGVLAVNLFRAQKASSRAKVYRGGERGRGSYRGMAYERKAWAISNVTATLEHFAEELGVAWGWSEDPAETFHRHVLYVDLPTGQVSFHAVERGVGPAYAGAWDGAAGASPSRICSWIARLFQEAAKS